MKEKGSVLSALILQFIILFGTLNLLSCNITGAKPVKIVEAPSFIRLKAYAEAERYIGMPYEYGGQDFPKGIDCSGLIVNVYYTATIGTGYFLLFKDASVKDLYNSYSKDIKVPERGDLIFMGEENSTEITHVAILDKIENNYIYFIDSTYIPEKNIFGVTYRSYPITSTKLKAYRRLIVAEH